MAFYKDSFAVIFNFIEVFRLLDLNSELDLFSLQISEM